MKPLDLNKPVQTRDGRPARIICTDKLGSHPIVYAVKIDDSQEAISSCRLDGTQMSDVEYDSDLINIPEKHTRTFWVNVYDDDYIAYHKKDRADKYRQPSCLACIPVTITFTEGEGLE